MLGKKRAKKENEEKMSQNKKNHKIITKEKKSPPKNNMFEIKSSKVFKNSEIKKDECIEDFKNDNFLPNINKDNFISIDNYINEKVYIKKFETIKQKFKQLDSIYEDNNNFILYNIDRLTSILSSLIISQNEKKKEESKDIGEKIFKGEDNEKKSIELNPVIVDANNDYYLNYLLTLNDALKKKYNESITFDEINKFFTNFAFDKIENFMNLLKSIN